MSHKDELFTGAPPDPFEFNSEVANVFEDMLERSIPMYSELQRMITQDIVPYYVGQSTQTTPMVVDLGCSKGHTLELLNMALPTSVTLCGVDSSEPMIQAACAYSYGRRQVIMEKAIAEEWVIDHQNMYKGSTSVVICSLTMQFMKRELRTEFLTGVHDVLESSGALILVEKCQPNHRDRDWYWDFKRRNGYTFQEILNKDAALDGVMDCYTKNELTTLTDSVMFTRETFFTWHNFLGLILTKRPLLPAERNDDND